MYRQNARFEIAYNMQEVVPGLLYSGTIKIDRPKRDKGYILPDFKPTTVSMTIREDNIQFGSPDVEHECIDSILKSIRPNDIVPEEIEEPKGIYIGKINKSINPNKWISQYLANGTFNVLSGVDRRKGHHE